MHIFLTDTDIYLCECVHVMHICVRNTRVYACLTMCVYTYFLSTASSHPPTCRQLSPGPSARRHLSVSAELRRRRGSQRDRQADLCRPPAGGRRAGRPETRKPEMKGREMGVNDMDGVVASRGGSSKATREILEFDPELVCFFFLIAFVVY